MSTFAVLNGYNHTKQLQNNKTKRWKQFSCRLYISNENRFQRYCFYASISECQFFHSDFESELAMDNIRRDRDYISL